VCLLEPPAGIIPPNEAPQTHRTCELLKWIDCPTGKGFQDLDNALSYLGINLNPTLINAQNCLTITISMDFNKLSFEMVQEVQNRLTELSEDPGISVVSIEEGSIKFTICGSPEGLRKIKERFDSGEFHEVTGMPIDDVQFIEKLDEKRRNLPSVDVTGVPVTALSFKDQISLMLAWAEQRTSKVVCVANVHMLVESRWDTRLRTVLEQADLTTPDGMPLVWMMKAMGIKNQDRVAGMDIFLSICCEASKRDISIYLLGSTQGVLDKMQTRLKQDFPKLKIAGLESPPFRPMTESEDNDLVDRINNSGAGVTFVALGCPKQESWMADHQGKINSVMVGVGAVFPVYAGFIKQSPKWVRDGGFGWLYRFSLEPKRLFTRYRRTIPTFVWLALRQCFASNSRFFDQNNVLLKALRHLEQSYSKSEREEYREIEEELQAGNVESIFQLSEKLDIYPTKWKNYRQPKEYPVESSS
jgi:N-acetylglucosaminyldiphosphoundecaprenol N-acetyl-beta-D-mannosaminyltransferase